MASDCYVCGESGRMLNKCNHCGRLHCPKHVLPENHRCPGLGASADIRDWAEHEEKFGGRGRTVKGTERVIRSGDVGTVGSTPDPDYESSSDVKPDGSIAGDDTGGGDGAGIGGAMFAIVAFPFVLFYWFISAVIRHRVKLLALAVTATVLVASGAVQVSWLLPGGHGAEVDEAFSDVRGGASDWASNITSGGSGGGELSKEESVERKVHELINEERRGAGINALNYDDELSEIADDHSEDMAEKGYFSHTSPGGETMGDRYDKAQYKCSIGTGDGTLATGAENIFHIKYDGMYMSAEEIAEEAVSGWMESRGHRENILTPYWRNEGVGVAITERGGYTHVYVTQNFC